MFSSLTLNEKWNKETRFFRSWRDQKMPKITSARSWVHLLNANSAAVKKYVSSRDYRNLSDSIRCSMVQSSIVENPIHIHLILRAWHTCAILLLKSMHHSLKLKDSRWPIIIKLVPCSWVWQSREMLHDHHYHWHVFFQLQNYLLCLPSLSMATTSNSNTVETKITLPPIISIPVGWGW